MHTHVYIFEATLGGTCLRDKWSQRKTKKPLNDVANQPFTIITENTFKITDRTTMTENTYITMITETIINDNRKMIFYKPK